MWDCTCIWSPGQSRGFSLGTLVWTQPLFLSTVRLQNHKSPQCFWLYPLNSMYLCLFSLCFGYPLISVLVGTPVFEECKTTSKGHSCALCPILRLTKWHHYALSSSGQTMSLLTKKNPKINTYVNSRFSFDLMIMHFEPELHFESPELSSWPVYFFYQGVPWPLKENSWKPPA